LNKTFYFDGGKLAAIKSAGTEAARRHVINGGRVDVRIR
jgi:hypothetical protein